MQSQEGFPFSLLVAGGLSLAGLAAIAFLLLTAAGPLPVPERAADPWRTDAADPLPSPPIARPVPYRHLAGWEEYPIKGRDRAGRVAAFRVLVLPGDQHWQFASDQVVLGRDNAVVDILARVQAAAVQELLAKGTHLISVGAASMEGSVPEEERRAAKRAHKLAGLLAPALPQGLALYTLNLGRHSERCERCTPADTAPQRRVVLIVVAAAHEGVDLRTALYDALSDNPTFPLDLQSYSRFELRRYPRGA